MIAFFPLIILKNSLPYPPAGNQFSIFNFFIVIKFVLLRSCLPYLQGRQTVGWLLRKQSEFKHILQGLVWRVVFCFTWTNNMSIYVCVAYSTRFYKEKQKPVFTRLRKFRLSLSKREKNEKTYTLPFMLSTYNPKLFLLNKNIIPKNLSGKNSHSSEYSSTFYPRNHQARH